MAAILPLGKTTFTDSNGLPLALGSVAFYQPGTTTPKTTWQDSAQTIPNLNPVPLDSRGQASAWGSGLYRQVVQSAAGVTIWDQVVSGDSLGSLGVSAAMLPVLAATTLPAALGLITSGGTIGIPLSLTAAVSLTAPLTATAAVTATSLWAGASPFTDWLGTYAYGDAGTPVMGLHAAGGAGVAGASRADLANSGSAPIGVLGFGFADGTGTKSAFPAWGGYFEARQFPGSTGYAHGAEINITNLSGATVALQPYNVFQAGGTHALWLASGGGVGVSSMAYDPATLASDLSAPVAASCAIGIVANGAPYQTGILFHSAAIAGATGTSGSGVAIGMGMGHTLEWYTPNGLIAGQVTSTTTTATPAYTSIQFGNAGLAVQNSIGQQLFGLNPVPPAAGATSMTLLINNSGGVNNVPVTLGAANSGGTGYRALVVPN